MLEITLYLKATGEIIGHGIGGEGVSFDTPEIGAIDGRHDAATHYVAIDEALERPVFTPTVSRYTLAADGVDTVTIGNLPDGAEIGVDGDAFVPVGGSSMEFAADVPATYAVALRCWPYVPVTFDLEAAAP